MSDTNDTPSHKQITLPLRIRIDFDNTLFAEDDNGQNYDYPVDIYAGQVIVHWIDEGHDVRILTCRDSKYNHEVKALLKANNLPDLPIINAPNKNIIAKLKYEWDILIDDNDLLYCAFIEREGHGNGRELILFNQHWNDYLDAKYIAFNWNDVKRIVKDICTNGPHANQSHR